MILAMGAAVSTASAQYQLANAGFEDWEETSEKYGFKTVKSNEPVSWSSFATMTSAGALYNGAAQEQLKVSDEVRPGSTGKSSAYIWGAKVLSVATAQGNLTNGCVYGGSMDPADASGNYNYTNESKEGQAMKFTGRPDAVKVWIKASTAQNFNISILLHEKGYYQDPFANADKCAKLIAHAKETPASNNGVWTEYIVPFVYDDATPNARPYYALTTFATSGTPGVASSNDKMWIDDVEMIYNSSLKSATYNGSAVEFNGTAATVNAPYDESKLALTSDGVGATIEKSFNASTAVLTITVKGDNISEDATNYHAYTIQFQKPVTAKMVVNSVAKWGTFVAPFDVEIPTGVNAYTVTDAADNGLLTLSPVTSSIKANTPVVLESEDGVNRTPQGYAVEGDPSEGLLKGVYVDTPVTSGYVLQNLGGRVGFYQVNGSITIPANRAYLNTTSNVKGFYFETATGIDRVESLEKKDEMYDLSGRRVKNATKGVYIVNGKKVLK